MKQKLLCKLGLHKWAYDWPALSENRNASRRCLVCETSVQQAELLHVYSGRWHAIRARK